jgi:hypothetical protein
VAHLPGVYMAKARIEVDAQLQQVLLEHFVQPIEAMLRAHIKILETKLVPAIPKPNYTLSMEVDPEVSIDRKNYNSPDFINAVLNKIQYLGSNASPEVEEQDIYRRADQLKACYGLLLILKEGKPENYHFMGNGLGMVDKVLRRMPPEGFPDELPSNRIEAFRLAYIDAQPLLNSTQESLKGFFSTIFKTPAKVALTNNINAKLLAYENEHPQIARKLYK